MELLVDANLSPRVASMLVEVQVRAVHVADLNMLRSTDEEIFDHAAESGRVIVGCDTDFPALLARRRTTSPSVLLLGDVAHLHSEDHVALLIANLSACEEVLAAGAVVSMSPTRLDFRVPAASVSVSGSRRGGWAGRRGRGRARSAC